ncbi:ABC transporter substrate-binding protein [Cupriavidus necator]|uniref:ABC transporter substrate-binding protein n=1 Tax=Cupriavidus necator TaxID=106590 RepID=A0A1U9V140_CUPNE|nr:tripartite tricarboxylate transporter substrate binding protein [Cupriavidus necator]AQV98688.1 ABC transporter substrate-binding protein [Cupriavidus necator]
MKPDHTSASRRRVLTAGISGALLSLAPRVRAQGYPERPVRIVSVTSPGTVVDDYTRSLAKYVGQKLGQSVIVENRPGGNLIVGTDYVAKSAPDGYTLLLTSSSSMSANRYLFKQLPYNPDKDFAPVARLASVSLVLVVPGTSPYHSIADLVAAARARPGSLNFGAISTGYRVMGSAFSRSAGMQVADIPYKGAAGLITDLIGGQVDYSIVEFSSVLSHIRAGKLRALAMVTPKRVPAMDTVPTLAEAGLQDATMVAGLSRINWFGLFAPAGTPAPIIDKLSRLSIEFVNSPEAMAHYNGRGSLPSPGTPAELARAVSDDQKLWQRMIATAGLQPE